jgi:pimeloyl-ACP methyl ester carboxylesterase
MAMNHARKAETGRVELARHALRFEGAGRGEPPLVLLHGLVDTLEIWSRIAEPLAARRRTIRVDQRGHGESSAPPGPYTREDLAADVVALLDDRGVSRAVLVGHSMGGIVAMTTALSYPERVAGLVLLGTASQCNERTAGWYERIALAGERDGCAGLARAIYGEKAKRRVVGDPQGIVHVTRTLKSLHPDPLTPRLAGIACPALLLVGEKDPMGPRASEIIAAALPDSLATLEVLPGLGHWLHVEAADAVVEALDRWLSRTQQGRDTGPEQEQSA